MTLRQKQFAVYSTVFLALLLLFFFLHVSTGFTYYSHSHLLAILLGGGTAEENTVVFDFRLVRAVLAVLIGMGLALSGAVFQQLTRNELAGPGLLGVNAGAGLGASHQVAAFQHRRDRLLLNRGGFTVTLLGNGAQDIRA